MYLSSSTESTVSDEVLVDRTLQDKQHFTALVQRFEGPLLRYIMRLGVMVEEDREDLLQEIFIKVYKNLNNFDNKLKFSSWIYRIAHNETMSWYRKRQVRPEGHLIGSPEEVLGLLSLETKNQEAQFDTRLDAERVESVLNELPEKYRAVLLLRYFEHKEYEEISDILRLPVGTVGTLVSRGKQKLRDSLDNNDFIV